MKNQTIRKVSTAALVLTSLLNALPATSALPTEVQGQALPSLAPILERVSPAVVSISVEGSHVSKQQLPDSFQFFFGPNFPSERVRERPFQGLGSGVIIDAKKGHIITNHHVIENASKIRIQLIDGREFDAKLIGGDSMSDIALLELKDAPDLTEISLANSDKLRVGDFAIAIGNPFGLGQTVTSGIISALGRSGLNLQNFENFIQTDAAINTGNSGGALINLNGELIGINTAILGPNGGNIGIGFAIPANMTKNIAEQILKFGEVKRGVLGVIGRELTSELAEAFGYETKHGAFVSQVVPDSAAEKAGIKAGDIITAVDNKKILTFSELRAKIATLGAGKRVKLSLIRDGKNKTVAAELNNEDEMQTNAETLHKGLQGAVFENYEKNKISGVLVTHVEKNSMAARYGLEKDDVIIGLNREAIKSIAELRIALSSEPNILALNILRNNSRLYLVIR